MKLTLEEPPDEESARAIASAMATHLGRSVELVVDGEALVTAGNSDGEFGDPVITDRERRLREDIEEILSGGRSSHGRT